MDQIYRPAPIAGLSGLRFFAVLHIFFYHLWSIYSIKDKPKQFENLLAGLEKLPNSLIVFFSHGYMATSFFFLLSGFVLAYVYWQPQGVLSVGQRDFWLARAIRIYPVHLIIMLITVALMSMQYIGGGTPGWWIALSALLTAGLLQSWVPPAIPMWSWPTWTLSAIVFLYAIFPWLVRSCAQMRRTMLLFVLCLMPLVSLIPTLCYSLLVPLNQEASHPITLTLTSLPLFWLPHFLAGMLLTRIHFDRQEKGQHASASMWGWGDLAFIAVLLITFTPNIEEPLKYFLRHGLLMPLFMLVVLDFAAGRGLIRRFFALPVFERLGQASFSMFIWQNLVMVGCWVSLLINPAAGAYQIWVAPLALIIMAVLSTQYIEKPIARRLRARWMGKPAE
jgi:peptidoglycan/LPS O-acetylase OafA/YrhL